MSWPADALRGASLPPIERQPEGAEAFLDIVSQVAPECEPGHAYPIGNELLGSEATMGWEPNPGQLDDERLLIQIKFIGMAVQALIERVEQAQAQRKRAVVPQAMEWFVAVVRSALRYLPDTGDVT